MSEQNMLSTSLQINRLKVTFEADLQSKIIEVFGALQYNQIPILYRTTSNGPRQANLVLIA